MIPEIIAITVWWFTITNAGLTVDVGPFDDQATCMRVKWDFQNRHPLARITDCCEEGCRE
jgi:hypothetical protein